MKKTILLIDDTFFAENYPMKFSIDVKRLGATIRLTQSTQMRDLLGDELYNGIMQFVADGKPEASPYNAIIDDVMYLQVQYTARGLFASYLEGVDAELRDYNLSFIDGNIKFLQACITTNIGNSPDLTSISNKDSGFNTVNNDSSTNSPIYYWK